ncbi:torsin-like protein [Elysia marginata]|uniref:Torsin-like protein n=1 Tax=Elysia marginata TaxID=1093978 RepID=A0AAV4GZT6_9GAST|nr:torsin-like protein [Elysia marginata]
MNLKAVVWVTFLTAQCAFPILCFGPVSGIAAGIAGIGSLIHVGIQTLKCRVMVCCDKSQIHLDFDGLQRNLSHKLHGQHLVQKAVLGHIKGHFDSIDPHKALVLSFHGLTGVGKNFVSRIIADNLYKDGFHSPFVHLISATKEFPHEGMLPFYKDNLKRWIEGNVTKCERSMFIFDEVDKLPSSLLDVIKPYTDHYEHLGGVSYRKAVFIFLSNAGGTEIGRLAFEHWQSGKKREDLRLSDIENSIMLSVINADNHNGLYHSQLISNHLITSFIPFLPLEKEHVRACITDDIVKKYRWHFRNRHEVPEEYVDEVIQELNFYPAAEQIFSVTGCKRVSEKVDFVMIDKVLPKRKSGEL